MYFHFLIIYYRILFSSSYQALGALAELWPPSYITAHLRNISVFVFLVSVPFSTFHMLLRCPGTTLVTCCTCFFFDLRRWITQEFQQGSLKVSCTQVGFTHELSCFPQDTSYSCLGHRKYTQIKRPVLPVFLVFLTLLWI